MSTFEDHINQPSPRWAVGANTSRGWIVYEISTGRHVAYVTDCPSGNEFRGPESQEHANLIASAPSLERTIRNALKTANGRWSEWGGRAQSVEEILSTAIEQGGQEKIGSPNVAAIVHQSQTYLQRADSVAVELWNELAFENNEQDFVLKVRSALQRFADSECSWRNAGDVTNTLRSLASAVKKIAPEAAQIIVDKYQQIDTVYKEFLDFLESAQ